MHVPDQKTSRKIIIATFIEPLDVLTIQGVTEIMKMKQEKKQKKILQKQRVMLKKTGEKCLH